MTSTSLIPGAIEKAKKGVAGKTIPARYALDVNNGDTGE